LPGLPKDERPENKLSALFLAAYTVARYLEKEIAKEESDPAETMLLH
jgi:hypothetical protein